MVTWGGLSVLGATTGIVVSGLVAAAVSWQWMFAVPLFVAGLALLLTPVLLPASRPAAPVALDAPGAVLATSGITLLSYGLVMTGDHSWLSATAGVPIAAGFILLVAFGVREARTRDPLLPPSFLADRRRAAALAVIGLSAAATAVVCLFLTLYLQQIRGWTTLRTSFAFVPYALALILVGRVAGRLVERLSYLPGETREDRDARIREQLPAGRVATLDEVAAAVLYLASPEAGFVVGTDLCIDGGDAA